MKTGIFAGSFDPVTNGHVHVVSEACGLVDKLFVAIGVNPAKQSYFTAEERRQMLIAVLNSSLPPEQFARIEVVFIEHDLLVNYAREVGATYIIRGIRNLADFEFEAQIQQVNRKIDPSIHSVYLITPPDLAEVSSSTVKGIVGFNQWESVVSQYVHPVVVAAFKARVAVSRAA